MPEHCLQVWRSDDGGRTYAVAPPFTGGGAEATMAETGNGTVVVLFRISQGGLQSTKGRLLATSSDGGSTFSEPSFEPDLKSTACQASLK